MAAGVNRHDSRHDGTDIARNRTQAAIRRCGELLKQVEPKQGANQNIHDATDTKVLTRTEAAKEAGLSERQKVTALRVANGEESSPFPP